CGNVSYWTIKDGWTSKDRIGQGSTRTGAETLGTVLSYVVVRQIPGLNRRLAWTWALACSNVKDTNVSWEFERVREMQNLEATK
ncbi:hypothetical protein PHLCEN_2v3812, partial [Hermanssonia centrifuga]